MDIETGNIYNYIAVTELVVKNRFECWIAKALDIQDPTKCLGMAEGWSEVGATNNLARLMQAEFRRKLKEVLGEPERIINYRNL